MTKRLFLSLLLCATALATEPAVSGPTISPEMRARFWRANAEMLAAKISFEQAQQKLQAAQAEMVKACGEQQLIPAPNGEPMCQAKPEKPKEAK